MKLTQAEEQVMKHLWNLEKAYMKNIREAYPDPKPASTTIATLLKRMIDKGAVGFEQHGNNREYYPRIKKTQYFSSHINMIVKDFFNDSSSQFASFFTKESDLSIAEMEELKGILEDKIKKQQK
jgi:BlaI family transcriptional regulator, penicillinase repressor